MPDEFTRVPADVIALQWRNEDAQKPDDPLIADLYLLFGNNWSRPDAHDFPGPDDAIIVLDTLRGDWILVPNHWWITLEPGGLGARVIHVWPDDEFHQSHTAGGP
jgi:hypothetical protein